MTNNYENKLWGKIEFLHEKTLRENKNLTIFSDILTKFQNSLLEFSKSIDNIKNKNHVIIEEKGSTIDFAVNNFKEVLKTHIFEFKECSEHIKSSIVGPIMQTIDDKYTMEKEMYNQYNKTKNIYNNSKTNLEKAKKEFENSAKICEKNILNLVQLKSYSFNSSEDIIRTEERMKLSIANTKTLEDKYYKCLEDANKARENEIKKQNELLKHYQLIQTDFYLKINCIISFFIPMIKKMYSSILLSLDALEDRCKKIKISQDIDDFIEKNKTDLKPDGPILFVPYYPEASLEAKRTSGNDKKDIDNLDNNYNVILTLYQNFRDIRKDLNMEEEQKKYRLRFLCTKIFKIGPGMEFKKEEKNELISMLKEPFYKSYFLITLSKQRTKGRFQRSETLINDLSDILHFILDESEKINDFESAKNCIILSQTFYHDKPNPKNKKENKKIYLLEYIKNYKWFKTLNFWEGIIDFMTQAEISKTEKINKKNNINETPIEIKTRLSNIGFSQVLSYSNSMMEFKMNIKDIFKVIDTFVKKYEIDPGMAEAIYDNIKNSKQSEEDEEKEKYFKELEEKYEMKKENEKINNIDNNKKELKRSQTISNKNNEKTDLEYSTRSKSLKEKTTHYKIEKNVENNQNIKVNEINQEKKTNEQIKKIIVEKVEENIDNKNEYNKNVINNKDENNQNIINDKEGKNKRLIIIIIYNYNKI